MSELRNFDYDFRMINFQAPEGFVSVPILIKFLASEGTRYTILELDIPVKIHENIKLEDVKWMAQKKAKSYLSDIVSSHLPE